MGRKSKNAGGNMPLTHHERTKKFASSEYGTVTKRVAGAAQYQLGDCALSLSSLKPTSGTTSTALCTASGYLYAPDAILTYLLEQTQELKQQRIAWQDQQAQQEKATAQESEKKRQADFEASQKLIQPTAKRAKPLEQARQGLKRASFWLADAAPQAVPTVVPEPPARPASPHSGQPLRRTDLWPVLLQWNEQGDTLLCSVSDKALHAQPVVAYWTKSSNNADKQSQPGRLVLKTVYDQMVAPEKVCPQSGRKIKQVRDLQRGGSSFASSGQSVVVQKYRPTIT